MLRNFPKNLTYVILQITLVFISQWYVAFADFDSPTKSQTFFDFISIILDSLIQYAIPVVGAIIVWTGFRIVSAHGNEEQLRSAKRTLVWVVVGAGIVVGAVTIAKIAINFANSLG